jgi:monoamine oxidase
MCTVFHLKKCLSFGAPHIHTHFADEHLSENWQGFMEGALETGKEAADKI